MKGQCGSISVFFSFLLFTFSTAHTESQSSNNNNNAPLFGNVMRYFGESETGYGLPSSGLFEDVDTSQQQQLQQQQQVSICLPNFEVSVGSIIRTKDSQALGAHYLNETDLGAKSRDECFKLCCKVARCNVAVFEEKNSGSCYLFDCGSLEDFRCKFTTQTHYVSAILRHRETVPQQQQNGNNNPNSPPHSGSIMGAHINSHSHNQHEDELSQLRETDKPSGPRASPVAAALPVSVAGAAGVSNSASDGTSKSKQAGGGETIHGGNSGTSSSSSSSSTTSPVVLSDVTNVDATRRCSRWQFECKSSGECIAIYNVCDAIPNCPDGSDEGPELHCPVNNGYPTGDTSTNTKKQKGSSAVPAITAQQQQPQVSSQQQNHHPQPPVLINNGMEKPMTPTGNNGLGTGLKVPSRQAEEYPIMPNKPQQSIVDTDSGINVPRKNDQSINHFSHIDGGIMDNNGYGNHHHQPNPYSGSFWKPPGSSNYDYGNAETSNVYGPIAAPPQFSSNGGTYGTGTNYGNAQYQFGGYPNLQGPPQQQSPSQGLPIINQGQPQYPMNNINYGPQQQPQQTYYNPQQQLPPIPGNTGAVSVNSQSGVAQPTNVRNAGASQQVVSSAINPSSQQTQPQAPTTKPITLPQGVSQNLNNKASFSKVENDFMKSLKAQSLQSGTSEMQSEELSPHTAGAGAMFIFILGLGMSIIMVIIVGCRLRRVARRQRGKNRLDPDYLVDGMYL